MSYIGSLAHSNYVRNQYNDLQHRMQKLEKKKDGHVKGSYYGDEDISHQSYKLILLENKLANQDQYLRNLKNTQLHVDSMDKALTGMYDLGVELKKYLVRDYYNESQMSVLKTQSKILQKQMFNLMNKQFDNRYLFVGQKDNIAPVNISEMSNHTHYASGWFSLSKVNQAIPAVGTKKATIKVAGGMEAKVYYDNTMTIKDLVDKINKNVPLQTRGVGAYLEYDDQSQARLVVRSIRGESINFNEFHPHFNFNEKKLLNPDVSYYQGDHEIMNVKIDDNLHVNYGITANQPPFENMIRAMRLIDQAEDKDDFDQAQSLLNESIKGITGLQTNLGIKQSLMDRHKSYLENTNVFIKDAISSLKDLDLAWWIHEHKKILAEHEIAALSMKQMEKLSLINIWN